MKRLFLGLFIAISMLLVLPSVNANEVKVSVPKVQMKTNGTSNDYFYVTLEKLDQTSPMPGNEANSTIRVNNKDEGIFKDITFTERGTYKYKIYQSYMNNSQITYDNTVYTLTIDIINESDTNFNLKAVSYLEKSGTDIKQDKIVFNNIYKTKKETTPGKAINPKRIINPYTGDRIIKYFIISVIAVLLILIIMIYIKNSRDED